MSSEKSKTMPMQIFFGGVEAVYYGIVQVENAKTLLLSFLSSAISNKPARLGKLHQNLKIKLDFLVR